jgi:hypothetical protein
VALDTLAFDVHPLRVDHYLPIIRPKHPGQNTIGIPTFLGPLLWRICEHCFLIVGQQLIYPPRIDLFFQNEPCSARILHRSSFVASLSLPTTHPDFPPTLLLHAICCAASRWASHDAPSRQEKFSEFHATKTRTLLDTAVRSGSTDLGTFQASIILQYWAYAEGRNLDM